MSDEQENAQKHPVPEVDDLAEASVRRSYVLIIDDVANNRKLFSRLLKKYGYDIEVAKNVSEAAEFIWRKHPDIILADIHLGEGKMNALEFVQQLKRDTATRDIPVIAITSQYDEYDEKQAHAVGCDRYYPLPMNLMHLVSEVSQVIEIYREKYPACKEI